ncbi:ABC transporter ATP-binding protein [Streptococcus pneumoniae]|nr:ABC transporter ATP-binding protein [Streptococcus pneumoniae]
MRLLPIRKISRQSKRLALFLTFCAGYVDAYTFIVRGNTLVAGQTGNVVFLSVELIKNNRLVRNLVHFIIDDGTN